MSNLFKIDLENIGNLPREKYMKIYHILGDAMWELCDIPNVGDFAKMINENNEESKEKIKNITDFTGNYDETIENIEKTEVEITNEMSNKHIDKVIASNSSDISDSGFFYKKLISSCDNIKIDDGDCGSKGREWNVSDIDKATFNYRIKNQYINELGKMFVDWNDFKDETVNLDKIHVRSPLYCNHSEDGRKICKKCAGLFYRSYDNIFTPYDFGIYSTLMITEKATQASLDSMNKGKAVSINEIIEKLKFKNGTKEEFKKIVEGAINEIRSRSRYHV